MNRCLLSEKGIDKMERKIFNYKSVILVEKTFEEFGYYPEKYGRTSTKFIMAICRFCGEEMKVRKGFFNKSGSACHKKCQIEEMKLQKSPFSDPDIRKKAQKSIEKKYGKDRKLIGEKISKTKGTKESKEKTKKTCLDRYGVENVFQSEEIKTKIKTTTKEKYGVGHHMQNKHILEKTKKTVVEKYGVDNVMKIEEVRKTAENTNWSKYGCPNPMQNKDVAEKTRETNLQR